jgi:hypothetical protein
MIHLRIKEWNDFLSVFSLYCFFKSLLSVKIIENELKIKLKKKGIWSAWRRNINKPIDCDEECECRNDKVSQGGFKLIRENKKRK